MAYHNNMEEDGFIESVDGLIKTIKDLIVKPIQRFTGFASLGLLLVVLLLTSLVFLFIGIKIPVNFFIIKCHSITKRNVNNRIVIFRSSLNKSYIKISFTQKFICYYTSCRTCSNNCYINIIQIRMFVLL